MLDIYSHMRLTHPLFEMLLGTATAAMLGGSIWLLFWLGFKATDVVPFMGALVGAGATALISIWSVRYLEDAKYREDAMRLAASLEKAAPMIRALTPTPADGADFVARRISVAEEGWHQLQFDLSSALEARTNLTWSQRAKVSALNSHLGWLWDMRAGLPRPEGEAQRTVVIVMQELEEAIALLRL